MYSNIRPIAEELMQHLPTQAALDALPIAMYYVDALGVIRMFNRRAAELWGREPKCGDRNELFSGAHRLYWCDGRHLPNSQCPLADALLDGTEQKNKHLNVERPDGSRRMALVNARPLRDRDGKIVGGVNTLVDVTDWKPRAMKCPAVEMTGAGA
jgi:PAS domain-containing protein